MAEKKPPMVVTDHEDRIEHAAYSPDGATLATASGDGSVMLWDPKTGSQTKVLTFEDKVKRLFFSGNGAYLALIVGNTEVKLHSLETGSDLSPATNGLGVIRHLDFSPNDKFLAAAGSRGLRLWRVEDGQVFWEDFSCPDVKHLAFSPKRDRLATACADGNLYFWHVPTGRQIQVFSGHEQSLTSVMFSSDGQKVITASEDGSAWLLDISLLQRMIVFPGSDQNLTQIRFGDDAARMLTISYDTVRLWDTESGICLKTLPSDESLIIQADFSSDGKLVFSASEDGLIRVWDGKSGTFLREVNLSSEKKPINHGPLIVLNKNAADFSRKILYAGFSPDGTKLVATTGDGAAYIWENNKALQTLHHVPLPVRDAAFNPAGVRLITALADGTIKLWDLAVGRIVGSLTGHLGEALRSVYSPDGKRIVTASGEGAVFLWDKDGTLIAPLDGHTTEPRAINFTRDGKILATVDDRRVFLWNSETGALKHTLDQHTARIHHVAFSPGGARLASASEDKRVLLWNVAAGRLTAMLAPHDKAVSARRFFTGRQRTVHRIRRRRQGLADLCHDRAHQPRPFLTTHRRNKPKA